MQRLGLRERLRETEVIDAWSKIVGDFIAAHSAPVALREGILYVRVLQPALHYELEQISKSEILRKLKQRFGGKTIRDIRFRLGKFTLLSVRRFVSNASATHQNSVKILGFSQTFALQELGREGRDYSIITP